MKLASLSRRAGETILSTSILLFSPSSILSAIADEGTGPHVHEERHSLEGLPIVIVISALIIAVGLAYGIGRRSRK